MKESSGVKDLMNEIKAKRSHLDEQKQKKKNEMYSSPQLNMINSILQVNYRVPEGFNKSDVYGKLISLFTPKEKKFCLPLEVIGAVKLSSVVVTDKNISTRLLKGK